MRTLNNIHGFWATPNSGQTAASAGFFGAEGFDFAFDLSACDSQPVAQAVDLAPPCADRVYSADIIGCDSLFFDFGADLM